MVKYDTSTWLIISSSLHGIFSSFRAEAASLMTSQEETVSRIFAINYLRHDVQYKTHITGVSS